jgi:hypothetical protein
MDKFVAKANIEHYRRRLATEPDEAKRQVLARLLAEEEAKLAVFGGPEQKRARSGRMIPGSPMSRVDVDVLVRFRVDPSAEHPAAGKDERVRAVFVDHGQFQVFVEGRAGHGLPHKKVKYPRGLIGL